MANRFNWETDDEKDWASDAPDPQRATGGRRKWLLIVLVAAVACGFLLSYALLARRLAAREETIAADVLAAHSTWERAVTTGDLELFASLLSRDNSTWYTTQRHLFLTGEALDRPPLDLRAVAGKSVAGAQVDVESTWREAEVIYPQRYRSDSAGQSSEPFTLRQTALYRLDGSHWEQAQPGSDFWGKTQRLDSPRVTVEFPSRDADLVERLSGDLTADLDRLCAERGRQSGPARAFCSAEQLVSIRFDPDPVTLANLPDARRPILDGRTFVLPAPTLVGLPIDDRGYAALYAGYTRRILNTIEQMLALPVDLPDQKLDALCLRRDDNRMVLAEYEPQTDQWEEIETRRPYRFLRSLPGDEGVVLRAGYPGTDLDRLQLALRRPGSGEETDIVDIGDSQLAAGLVSFVPGQLDYDLLLRFGTGVTGIQSYGLAPLAGCEGDACHPAALDGFPLWSPDGRRTLISRAGQLYVADGRAQNETYAAKGFSPFWVTPDVFGYVRLSDDPQADAAGMLVQLQSVDGTAVTLTDSHQTMEVTDSQQGSNLRIQYLAASPVDPRLIFLAGSPVGSIGDEYYVLALHLQGDLDDVRTLHAAPVEVRLKLDDLPIGDTATLTPTGYPPFALSADGRWLTVIRFTDQYSNEWQFHVHDISADQTRVVTSNFPIYPARFPYYDWSGDSQWMALVDRGLIRLVAPGYDYERVVTHDFRACTYLAWVNRSEEP